MLIYRPIHKKLYGSGGGVEQLLHYKYCARFIENTTLALSYRSVIVSSESVCILTKVYYKLIIFVLRNQMFGF